MPSRGLVLHEFCDGQHDYHDSINRIMQLYHMTPHTGSLLNVWYVPSVSPSLETGLLSGPLYPSALNLFEDFSRSNCQADVTFYLLDT